MNVLPISILRIYELEYMTRSSSRQGVLLYDSMTTAIRCKENIAKCSTVLATAVFHLYHKNNNANTSNQCLQYPFLMLLAVLVTRTRPDWIIVGTQKDVLLECQMNLAQLKQRPANTTRPVRPADQDDQASADQCDQQTSATCRPGRPDQDDQVQTSFSSCMLHKSMQLPSPGHRVSVSGFADSLL